MATVVIFQIITLAGWSDIMYKIQDVHSFWNWIYFVFLVVLGSYFMTNLFFVVITSQFQQTKQREKELMKKSRLRSRASVSTVSSSLTQQGCYTQLLQYLEHLCRRFKKYICSKIKMDKESKRRRVPSSMQLKNRMDNVESIHHHHHHYHYCHHYVHHHPCQCENEITYSPPTSNAPAISTEQSSHPYIQSVDHTLRMSCDTSDLKIDPYIQVTAQATTALYQDTGDNSSGKMVSTATANINIDGDESSENVITYSKTAAPVNAIATKATEKTLEVACSCAARHSEDENVNVIKNACNDYIYSFDDDDVDSPNTKKKCLVKIRYNLKAFVESRHFMRLIMVSIFLNTISMAIEHHGQPKKMTNILETVNVVFTSIFAIEMLIKIAAFGPYGYIKDAYNLFDGVIVIVSFMDILADSDTSGLSVMRSFRVLRIFKLVRFMPELQRQLAVMVRTLDNVMSFLALLALFVFTSSIFGMHLFGGKFQFANEDGQLVTSRANFDTLFWALVTVFQILTEADWNVVLFDGIRSLSSWSSLYFIFIMVIGDFILFNLLVSIIVEGFIDHAAAEKEELLLKNKNFQAEPSSPSAKLGHNPCMSEKEPYFSCPDLHTMYPKYLQRSQQLIRCTSAPCQSWSNYKRENTTSSQFHVLSLDEFKTEKDGKKDDKVQCQSLQEENTSLVFQIVEQVENENETVDNHATSCLKRRQEWSLFIFSPENKLRRLVVKIHQHPWFDRVVLLFILINCIVMVMEEPGLDKNSEMGQFIQIMQYIFTTVFTIEMSIKVISMGLIIGPDTYLKSGWNIVDGILVLISLVDLIVSLTTEGSGGILGILRVFRAFRTLRPLRVINRAPELKLVVETLISSLKPIGNFSLIAATFFVIFGILGVQLFKGKFYSCNDAKSSLKINNKDQCISNDGNWMNNVYNFDNLASALLTLFVFSTCDGWTAILYSGIDAVDVDKQPKRDYAKWNILYFIAFLLIAGFIVMNMLVGIVIENFHKCCDEQKLKEQNSSAIETVNTRLRPPRNSISEIADPSIPEWRQKLFLFVTHAYFDLAIAIVIGINVVCMAMEHYNQPKMLTLCLQYANYIFTFLFVLEAVLKLIAFGIRNYFKDRWNCLDMFIVILSIGGIILDELATSDLPINPTIIRVIRVLRITRVLKLLKTAEGIRSLLDTIGKALPQVINLGILFLLLFFIFGALGMELFGHISCDKIECNGLDRHAHFRNFGYSLLTLFRVSTGDNWNGILKDTMNSKICKSGETERCVIINNIAPIFFSSFVLITQFVLLNVVVAVLMKHLEESKLEETKSVKNETLAVSTIFHEKHETEGIQTFSKQSQTSLRSRRSENGILKKKRGQCDPYGQRRSMSMGELENNNGRNYMKTQYCFKEMDLLSTRNLGQRKVSSENEFSDEEIHDFATSNDKKGTTIKIKAIHDNDSCQSTVNAFVVHKKDTRDLDKNSLSDKNYTNKGIYSRPHLEFNNPHNQVLKYPSLHCEDLTPVQEISSTLVSPSQTSIAN
ncbi:voltage-dependent T-type calcium channel subunit alpha-1G-like [Xenia sp. Carnegie-2017]|uniref:voltage-dependent T-type calcium channel subunit alpha-1G-like n=1 Tax=Xenia sp. Carnegie-2017 TaxID=2897299 RepID=UPI001F0423C3|nr:voltage-dependent T-type calcium channel subunit alpha-1G-like [Xenia sp. Carnegie-2017]